MEAQKVTKNGHLWENRPKMGKNSKIGPIDDPGLIMVRSGLKIQDDWVSFKVQRHPKKNLSVFKMCTWQVEKPSRIARNGVSACFRLRNPI